MKTSKFTSSPSGRSPFVLKQVENGTPVAEVCRKAGIAEATFYNWRKRYAGLIPSEVKRLRQLEEENAKLERIVADLSLDKAMLQGRPDNGDDDQSGLGHGLRSRPAGDGAETAHPDDRGYLLALRARG